jgi:transcriptional regulator with XRE-family HTH domain
MLVGVAEAARDMAVEYAKLREQFGQPIGAFQAIKHQLAELAGVSLPTIQRMEASEGNVRGVVDSLTKVVEALDRAGIELIGEGAISREGGRGVRLKPKPANRPA